MADKIQTGQIPIKTNQNKMSVKTKNWVILDSLFS